LGGKALLGALANQSAIEGETFRNEVRQLGWIGRAESTDAFLASASRVRQAFSRDSFFNPNSPEVRKTATTRSPRVACLRKEPPHPMDSSSGWGAMTSMFMAGA